MRITVAVCTWNRARSLQRALTSIATAVEAFGHSVQLVVVNNNCTDHTDSVVELLAKRIAVTYVHEPRVGLANARNAAIRETSGEYIIWTDDDVVVCAGWIAAYAKAFVEYPDATFFGGPIRPLFDMAPPAWLAAGWPKVAGIYAVRDLGERPVRISTCRDLPYGANFALKLGQPRPIEFDTRLGRQPANYWLGGEEVQVLSTLLEERCAGQWVPDAEVLHCIAKDRQTLAYIARHAFGSGQSKELRQPTVGGLSICGRPLSLWTRWLRALSRIPGAVMGGRAAEWLPTLYQAAEWSGRLYTGPGRSSRQANQ